MSVDSLYAVAKAMVAPGKGVLAIDESQSTCKKRFDALGIACDEEHRRAYRQLLVTAPVGDWISGMILFDETLRQKTNDGTAFVTALKKQGILPGIKVDAGTKPLALHFKEVVTEGLDGLANRLQEYRALGAEFAKWRAVIAVDAGLPSPACLKANAHALARYAALCQEAGLVPMVEPEILLDGNHSLERCQEVSAATWKLLFAELAEQGVDLKATILKTSMVLAGQDAASQPDLDTVAAATVETLMANVPATVAGVVFLSGGQSDRDATVRLNRMNQLYAGRMPWPLSFSYGRSIQRPALEAWAKNPGDVASAQALLAHRARMNALAAEGKYEDGMEK